MNCSGTWPAAPLAPPSNHAPPPNPLLNRLEIHHGYPVFWEGNIGSTPEHRSFPNGSNPPQQLLRLNVMFDSSIPRWPNWLQGSRRLLVQRRWWHQDAQRFAELFARRYARQGRAGRSWDRWPDKGVGEGSQGAEGRSLRAFPSFRIAWPRSPCCRHLAASRATSAVSAGAARNLLSRMRNPSRTTTAPSTMTSPCNERLNFCTIREAAGGKHYSSPPAAS
ncbi:hypothetical protein [Pseudomonas aeruginosa]|uniref:hypothetical protein n=1 Tax=Pseudomonas aeruginosa TaxID=287 RepID=UPI003CC85C00